MASLTVLLNIVIVALAFNIVFGKVNKVPLPPIILDEYWGPGTRTGQEDTSIHNFTIELNESMISDLKSRLQNHRPLVAPLEGIAFEYGFNRDTLELWRKYLIDEYPFAERQKYLNQFPHYKTMIQGINIHFMRVTAEHAAGTQLTPLMIVHGYPGSVREFYETVPYLLSIGKDNGLALDIIMPSIPGYAFSEGASKPGMGVDKVAVVLRNLMHRLGYSKFFIQGGDMGGLITNNMATLFPHEVLGYHTNFPLLHTPEIIFRLLIGNFHKEEVAKPELLDRLYPSWTKFIAIVARSGYLHIQSTKPDTFGIGLSDTPLGLITHTLITSGVPNNTGTVSAVQLCDNWIIYWSTNCITTAMRLYAETFNRRYVGLRINEIRSHVPTWVLQAPNELVYLPEWLIKMKFPNLVGVTVPSEGGHFYAWSLPQQFAQDVVQALVAFNKWHVRNSTLHANCSSLINN